MKKQVILKTAILSMVSIFFTGCSSMSAMDNQSVQVADTATKMYRMQSVSNGVCDEDTETLAAKYFIKPEEFNRELSN